MSGDGKLSVTDPIVLLRSLFVGDPPELPPACDPPELTARVSKLETQLASAQDAPIACQGNLRTCLLSLAVLADTGQDACYDENAEIADCDTVACAGQDGAYRTGCHPEQRFADNGDRTVTDSCTGLMWEKAGSLPGRTLSWCDALAYCEKLELAGHSDWSLHERARAPEYRRLRVRVPGPRPGVSPANRGSLVLDNATRLGELCLRCRV